MDLVVPDELKTNDDGQFSPIFPYDTKLITQKRETTECLRNKKKKLSKFKNDTRLSSTRSQSVVLDSMAVVFLTLIY